MAPCPSDMEDQVDLLIIGAGPAGLMAAAWASQYLSIRTRIIDSNSQRTQNGHADGLVPRTLEVLDSFDLAEDLYRNSYREIEMCSWIPDDRGRIQRSQRLLTSKVGISRYQGIGIHQGHIEQSFLDWYSEQPSPIEVERNVKTQSLILDEASVNDLDAYPVILTVQHDHKGSASMEVSGHNDKISNDEVKRPSTCNGTNGHHDAARTETIKAKYLIGCDGARSWTRRQAGLTLEGESTDHIWGVIDIVPLTNFPDIRQSCAIHTKSHGSIMLVPRENKLVRFYIQLSDLETAIGKDKSDLSSIKRDDLIAAAKKILSPYTLDYRICDWWSVYRIGQRVAPRFHLANRIFLAGDAVHTHSPKMGQGMNVSMQDTYNLGWKVCSVIAGQTHPAILSTYQTERHAVAEELISVDRQFAEFYSNPKSQDIQKDNQAFRNQFYDFLSGVAVEYAPSPLVASSDVCKQELAKGILLGRRIPSFRVVNQAEARPVQLHDILKSTGKWRILVFAGAIDQQQQWKRLQELGNKLAKPEACIQRYRTRSGKCRIGELPLKDEPLIELFTIHSAPRTAVELLEMHDVFRPWSDELGYDYWKVYTDDHALHEGFEDAYAKWGINRECGCIVVCRPDQHASYVGALEDVDSMEAFFKEALTGAAY